MDHVNSAEIVFFSGPMGTTLPTGIQKFESGTVVYGPWSKPAFTPTGISKMTLTDLKGSGRALLSDIPPWGVISSKALAKRFDVDVYAFGQWRYRGILPASIPDEAVKGRVNGYVVADFQSWLDPSLAPIQRFREAFRPILGDEADAADDDMIRLYAASEAMGAEPVGLTLTPKGRAIVSTFIRQMTSE